MPDCMGAHESIWIPFMKVRRPGRLPAPSPCRPVERRRYATRRPPAPLEPAPPPPGPASRPSQQDLAIREDTVLIGHSSGAEAAMRYAEENRVAGAAQGLG
jgi:hypothetical protein